MEQLSLLNLPLLLGANSGGGQGAASGAGFGSFLPIVAIILVFYLFMIRPQQRRQKEQKQRSENLKKGDKVVTIGGIHGIVTDLHEKTVTLKTGKDSHVEFGRQAISTVVNPNLEASSPPARRSFFPWKKEQPAADMAKEKMKNAEDVDEKA